MTTGCSKCFQLSSAISFQLSISLVLSFHFSLTRYQNIPQQIDHQDISPQIACNAMHSCLNYLIQSLNYAAQNGRKDMLRM